MAAIDARWHDGRHPGTVEEWVFAAWTPDAGLGVVSGHRILGRTAWYWSAVARPGRPLLHVVDTAVPVRADPFVVKGEALWAEHQRDAPMEQWSIGNETYAAALDHPDEALERAYGTPTPIALDLEWYATAPPVEPVDLAGADDGYEQEGTVHGAIEIQGEPTIELVEVPARRWHRWRAVTADDLSIGAEPGGEGAGGIRPIRLAPAVAHAGVRAPFAFPDGTVADLVLTTGGWRARDATRRSAG